MSTALKCPGCQTAIKLPPKRIDSQELRCPSCGRTLRLKPTREASVADADQRGKEQPAVPGNRTRRPARQGPDDGGPAAFDFEEPASQEAASGRGSRRGGDASRRPSNAGLLVGLMCGGLVLVAGTVGGTLWATGFFASTSGQQAKSNEPTNTNSAGSKTKSRPVPQESGRPEPKKAPTPIDTDPMPTPQPTKTKATTTISGELFVSTRNGDVKKGAGETIYLAPLTLASRAELVTLSGEFNQILAVRQQHAKRLQAQYPMNGDAFTKEYSPFFNEAKAQFEEKSKVAIKLLVAPALSTTADSDAKFKIEVPPGKYVLWTTGKMIGQQSFAWCKIIDVESETQHLILNDNAGFLHKVSVYVGQGPVVEDVYQTLVREVVLRLGS
jgi:hypothetical protein